MFIHITPDPPSYTAEQMFTLLATICDAELPHGALQIIDLQRGDDEMDGITIGKFEPKDGGSVGYMVSQDEPPFSFCIDVRAFEVQSQETIDGEFVPKHLCWFAQHDSYDLNMQAYVERWYHTMHIRLIQNG